MILCFGLDTDATVRNFLVQAIRQNVAVQPVNLRAFIDRGHWTIHIDPRRISYLYLDGKTIELVPGTPVFHRLINLAQPGGKDLNTVRWHALLQALKDWVGACAGKCVNALGAGANNGSKPLHEEDLRAAGFSVPPSITSGCKDSLLNFIDRYQSVVAKTLCGTRSSCRSITQADLACYSGSSGPVHLQQRIFGSDARVHVVAARTFVAHAQSKSVDYRDASDTTLHFHDDIPAIERERVVNYTDYLELTLAGWDFKIDIDGRWWCLEVNPMPGYDGHDRGIEGRISKSIFDYLCGEESQ